MSETFSDDLSLALELADAADAIALGRFKSIDLKVTQKPDRTPVTDADRAVEQRIRELLAAQRPQDSLLGEEFGQEPGSDGDNGRQWIIDPIDGTANFLRGNPIWGSLIALAVDGVPVVGVASMPALGRRWWASLGGGAWQHNQLLDAPGDARQLRVSQVNQIEDAALSLPRLGGWAETGLLEVGTALHLDAWRTVGGSDLWSYCLVAEGSADATVEFGLQAYDLAAIVPIVEEAGGRFTSATGTPGPWGGSAVASNGVLHEELLRRLGAGK